jgi:Zn-finger nucleic acid-binding protein
LDKGELEKLLDAVNQATSEDRSHFADYMNAPQRKPAPRPGYTYDDDDYEDYHRKKYGKKSKMRSILDFFD